MKYTALKALLFAVALTWFASNAYSADYFCEVMTLKGAAFVTSEGTAKKPLAQGDLIKTGDFIEVESDSYVDLAYDKEWNNITRLGENSKMKIKSVYPTGLSLDRGDLFSKLQKLPKGTTFEVQTPTAVAAVRGTEFFTSVDERGKTDVVSLEHSVEVFNLDASGNLGTGVVVGESERTQVETGNEAPRAPEKATEADMGKVKEMNAGVTGKIKETMEQGRLGQVQTVGTVEAMTALERNYLGGKDSASTSDTTTDQPKPSDDQNKTGTGNNNGGGPGAGGGCPPDCGGSNTTPGGGKALSSDQMTVLRDQFVQMGGDPTQFEKVKDNLTRVNPDTFARVSETFSGGEFRGLATENRSFDGGNRVPDTTTIPQGGIQQPIMEPHIVLPFNENRVDGPVGTGTQTIINSMGGQPNNMGCLAGVDCTQSSTYRACGGSGQPSC